MDWKGREQSQNVEDRRGSRGGGGGKTPGILGIIVVLVGAYYGVDLSGLVGGSSSMGVPTQQASRLDSQQEAELNELSRVVLADTEKAWSKYFQQHGQHYTPTTMVLYKGGTSTACGTGQSAMGPFYCPGDQKVYLDLSFYEDIAPSSNPPAMPRLPTLLPMKSAITFKTCSAFCLKSTKCNNKSAKKRPMPFPSNSNCRPTVSPVFGDTTPSTTISSKPKTFKKRCLPPNPSATTACRNRLRAMSFPTALPTARPKNA